MMTTTTPNNWHFAFFNHERTQQSQEILGQKFKSQEKEAIIEEVKQLPQALF